MMDNQEAAALSTILNIPASIFSDEERLKRAQAAIAKENQAILEKYSAIFPHLTISYQDTADLKRLEKENAVCANCKGYPCKKSVNKGFQHVVTTLYNRLYFNLAPCKYAKIANNKRVAKIPPMYADKTFEDYRIDAGNANAVKGAKTLQNLYIFGNPGTGKTFLASIMANEFLKQGKSVIFTDTPSLLDQMKSTFDRESEATLEGVMNKLAKVEVLILDDLGTETPTQWAVERLYLVINSRYNAQKPLIVTSNYDLQQAADRLNQPKNGERGVTGSRIVSRIRGLCKVAQISGADKRRA